MRRTSRTLPIVLAGSDFAFSGFGSIQRYDNMFGPSNFNAEDIDDFLARQRDWGVDGGLRTVDAARIGELRREAAQACRAVYAHLGLADFTDEHAELAVDAAGSKDLGETDTLAVLGGARHPPARCTGCSGPTPRGTPRAARPTRPGTPIPRRPSRPATTPR